MRFLIAFIFLISNTTWAQTVGKDIEANSSTGLDYFTNYVRSPSAKKNAASVTTSSATVTKDTTNKIDNVASYSVDTSALNGYVEFILNTVYAPATGGNCEFKGVFLGNGSLYRAQIVDGSGNLLNQTAVLSPSDATKWQPFSVTYPCAASGSRKVRITQTEAGTSPAINVGKLYYGSATGIGTGSLQPQYVGSLKYAATANCEWSTTSTSFANFAADTDCASPTVTGGISAPATKIPGFVINNVKPGVYLFIGRGVFRETGGNGTHHGFRFNDGTNSSVQNPIYLAAGSSLTYGSINGEITYTSAQSNVTVQIQGITQGTDTTLITANGNNLDLEFSVYYYPPAGIQSVITPEQWNYDWTAYTPTFTGFGTVSPASNQCYHKREGSNLYLRCYFTSGTSTAVEARMSLPPGLTSASNLFTVTSVGDMAENFNGNAAVKILIEPSVSYITFGYQYTGYAGLTKALGTTLFNAGQGGSFTTGPIPIKGWTENQSAPQLIESVTSNASSAFRIEYATVSAAGVVSGETSDWINGNASISDTSLFALTFNTAFSSTPFCIPTNSGTPSSTSFSSSTDTVSTTAVSIRTMAGGAKTANGFFIICMGPR